MPPRPRYVIAKEAAWLCAFAAGAAGFSFGFLVAVLVLT